MARKNQKLHFFDDQKYSKKSKSLDCSPGRDMRLNFKVIFFYAYPKHTLSTVKILLKNIVKQKSWFWLTFKIWPCFGPPCIVISYMTKFFYSIRITIQSCIPKLLIKVQKVILSGQKKSKTPFFRWSKVLRNVLKKLKSLDCSPGLDMGPNFKVIFFYVYPMPKLSTVKKLL